MTQEDLAQTIYSHTGFPAKIRGREIIVETCIKCSNTRWNLQVNQKKGVVNCWACDYSGTVKSLLVDIGYTGEYYFDREEWSSEAQNRPVDKKGRVIPRYPIENYSEALWYLNSRGLALYDATHYGIKYSPKKFKDPWSARLVFPVRDYFSSTVLGYQGRAIGNTEPKYLFDKKITEIAGYRHNCTTHVITEGVFDAIKIHKAGFNAVILFGLGNIKESEKWRGFAGRLMCEEPDHDIVLMLDGGTREETNALHQHITQVTDRCSRIYLKEGIDAGMLTPDQIKGLIGE